MNPTEVEIASSPLKKRIDEANDNLFFPRRCSSSSSLPPKNIAAWEQKKKITMMMQKSSQQSVTSTSTALFEDVTSQHFEDSGVVVVENEKEEEATELDDDYDVHALNKDLFTKAYRYINPGPLFRFIVYLYAERKLYVLFFAHALATMTIWFHFGLVKFEQQKDEVPVGAPFYWWKRVVPPVEFGSMHAILFQMALLPLTMSRYSIATMSDSILSRFIPLNRMVRMHIHLGYTMITIVFVATVLFFIFFGHLCRNDQQEFCTNFRSEIMCTGYGILASLLIIGGTSYFRHKIPYGVFYAVHHLTFAMYAITIAHTLDGKQRDGQKSRSQTFLWFSSTLLYYFCDRAVMHLNHRYRARVVSSSAVTSSSGSRMLYMKLRRPVLFMFKPGQYAFLKVGKLDNHWHPFSIASGPMAPYIEFYIEVFDDKSWTGKLWYLLNGDGKGGFVDRVVDVDILGPYGTSLGKMDDYSHVLAIGAGTGIVPILSLFKQHVRQLIRFDPDVHFRLLEEHQKVTDKVEKAVESRKRSLAQQLWGSMPKHRYQLLNDGVTRSDEVRGSIELRISELSELELRDASDRPRRKELRRSAQEIKKAAFAATRSIYGVVALAFLPVFGITLFGMTISWNTIPIDLYDGMLVVLKTTTIAFQICFALVALFVWDGSQFLAFTDMAICLVTPGIDIFFFYEYDKKGTLSPPYVTIMCLMIGYMTARLWGMTVRRRHRSWKSHASIDCIHTMERLEIIWVARSASLISEILPDIDAVYGQLVQSWGYANALRACRFSVYCTDKDPAAEEMLKKELSRTALYQRGFVNFGRPKFGRIMEEHTLDVVSTRRHSYSLMAFCGSPELGQTLHSFKITNDMVTAITGHKKHQMEFISESYGGVRRNRSMEQQVVEPMDAEADLETPPTKKPTDRRSRRITTSYIHQHRA